MAERIQLSRKKGWRLPAGARKVDRATVFGNPFKVGEPNGLGWGEVRDTGHAVWLYRHWLTTPSRTILFELDRHDEILRRLPSLSGHDLACWCTAGGTCHADVLLEISNRPMDVTAYAQALLTGTGIPFTADEATTAIAQLASAQGQGPADVENIASTLTALADERRARAGGQTP